MKKIAITLSLFLLIVITFGCSPKVSRINTDQEIDLSGRWNDTDSRLVSEQMIQDAISGQWLSNYSENHNRRPFIVVGTVKNKTSEHISAETFIKDIEREILNSAKARIIQGGTAREELRRERDDQQDYASLATMKKWGQELGADFIMQGTINSITDSNKRQKLIFYQVDMELTDVETSEKVWIGNKRIRKVVK
jgi:uncharacterized protein (TIGR02722 family)